MLTFWVIIALMLVIALLFATLPLLLHSRSSFPSVTSLSLSLHKEQLQHLLQQKQRGEITADEYDQMRLEYEKSLLSEIPIGTNPVANSNKPAMRLAVSLLGIIPIAALVLYLFLGDWRELTNYQLAEEKTQKLNTEIAELGSIDNIINRLKQRLQQHPDGQGWFLLGRLYMKNQHFPEAVAAFAQAEQLAGSQPQILVAYAEALYFANHQSFNPQARALLKTSLQLQPNQPEVINLLAVDAYQQGHYQQATAYWEQLLPHYAPDSEEGRALLSMIAQAQQQLGKTANTAKILLPISVQLAPALSNKLQGDETLFIYAQAVSGPAMPLAVVRRSVQDLPLEVTLTEQMGMMPGVSLNDFNQIRIIARISRSGQPLAGSGDLEGSSDVITVHQPIKKISVIINRVI